jgi:hypothetical protein
MWRAPSKNVILKCILIYLTVFNKDRHTAKSITFIIQKTFSHKYLKCNIEFFNLLQEINNYMMIKINQWQILQLDKSWQIKTNKIEIKFTDQTKECFAIKQEIKINLGGGCLAWFAEWLFAVQCTAVKNEWIWKK